MASHCKAVFSACMDSMAARTMARLSESRPGPNERSWEILRSLSSHFEHMCIPADVRREPEAPSVTEIKPRSQPMMADKQTGLHLVLGFPTLSEENPLKPQPLSLKPSRASDRAQVRKTKSH